MGNANNLILQSTILSTHFSWYTISPFPYPFLLVLHLCVSSCCHDISAENLKWKRDSEQSESSDCESTGSNFDSDSSLKMDTNTIPLFEDLIRARFMQYPFVQAYSWQDDDLWKIVLNRLYPNARISRATCDDLKTVVKYYQGKHNEGNFYNEFDSELSKLMKILFGPLYDVGPPNFESDIGPPSDYVKSLFGCESSAPVPLDICNRNDAKGNSDCDGGSDDIVTWDLAPVTFPRNEKREFSYSGSSRVTPSIDPGWLRAVNMRYNRCAEKGDIDKLKVAMAKANIMDMSPSMHLQSVMAIDEEAFRSFIDRQSKLFFEKACGFPTFQRQEEKDIKILHAGTSNKNAYKARIDAEYAGVQVELAPNFEMGVSNKSPEFLNMNPIGKVPVLETPDGPVFESNSIARYVARLKGNNTLYGSSLIEYAHIEQWIDFSSLEIEANLIKWYYPRVGWAPYLPPAEEIAIFALKRALDALNTHLVSNTYLVGHSVTLADIIMTCNLYIGFTHLLVKSFTSEFPHVERYFWTLVNQPNFRKILGQVK